MAHVLIIGSGLGSLATALRLTAMGHAVTILEKKQKAGGRLNQIVTDGFKFDIGPSFMSMSYELEELFSSCGLSNPFELRELDPLHCVYFEGRKKPFLIWKDLDRLGDEFREVEPGMTEKVQKYLRSAKAFYHDTEGPTVRSNFDGWADYAFKLTRVPLKHLPYLFRNLWEHINAHFSSEEVKVLFSLPAFFLGDTPFRTPAIFAMLNYVELQHNGYWAVEGGIYSVVEKLVGILKERGVKFVFDTEVVGITEREGRAVSAVDQNGRNWAADIFVCNSDAAAFRGLVLKRPKFAPRRLDRMRWSMAPFTIYLGVRGNIPHLRHHNYFLGNNFNQYARTIFTSAISPQKPYYYANVPSKSHPECAPEGCENILILCPVPDLRYKREWNDREALADQIVEDFSLRVGFDVRKNLLVRQIWTPLEWEKHFNLYRGSGLGLCHGMRQLGALRPSNKDEAWKNFYYVGASTIPGTGLPMVIIGSKLVAERIQNDFGRI